MAQRRNKKCVDPLHEIRTEVDTYHRLLPFLLKEHPNRWALISGKSFIASFANDDEAFKAAYALFGQDQRFIVQKVEPRRQQAEAAA